MQRMKVIIRVERRRRYPNKERAAILAQCSEFGAERQFVVTAEPDAYIGAPAAMARKALVEALRRLMTELFAVISDAAMPRYFFHSADGGRDPDTVGTELEDDAAAQIEAVRYAGEALRWRAQKLWQQGQWRIEVTDERGVMLFTVITIAVDAPKPDGLRERIAAND